MADQDYPNLYALMEASVARVRDAALAYEMTLGGSETDMVPVNGYPNQPTIAGRVEAYLDILATTLESAAMIELRGLIQASPPGYAAFSVTDKSGFVLMQRLDDGTLDSTGFAIGPDGVKTAAYTTSKITDAALRVVDKAGFIGMELGNGGSFLVPETGEGVADDRVARRNAENLSASLAVRGEFNTEVQRPTAKYNHYPSYGQSLMSGFEGWPALSKTSRNVGALMLGNSNRPAGASSSSYTPLGGSTLNPLAAVVQSISGATILTDVEVAALTPGDGNEGESPDVGAMNFARKQFLQYFGVAQDTSRLFVTSNAAVAGRSIEQLSKGASPELYNRLIQATQAVKAIAVAESASYCIPAIFFMQGEYNYNSFSGSDTTKEGYKSKLKAQSELWKSDLAVGVAGQTAPPAIITYQTGASYTSDTNDLAIGMAQWELSEEERNWYMATPIYPYTDKGGHLDPNGYRWVGMQLGKVLHRVSTLGQNWKPLSPRGMTIEGREILIDFHVPCPPLVFADPYVILAPTSYTDKGFRVLDALGTIAITSVEIAADTIVRITLGRDVSGAVKVQYASKTASNGNGNLRDSDDTVASENYEYQAGTGQYAGADIAALVGKPYPLHNWCIAFSLAPEAI